jgi:thiamine biosynthesis lipoprotein
MTARRLLAAVLTLLASTAAATTQVHYVMGTMLRVDVDGDVAPDVLGRCFATARELDRTFSRFDPASELVRLNATGGGPASEEFRQGMGQAMELARATHGAFDVSVGALTALWRAPRAPGRDALVAARRTVGDVALAGDRVVLGPGTQLDFDGFAKGLAVDACVAALRAAGVTAALVTFGESSLYALGTPHGAPAWRFRVRGVDPAQAIARLELRDEAAAVSAVYGGAGRTAPTQHGHLVDPRSGACLTDDVVGVVVAASATAAEAYAKVVLVDGPRAAETAGARGAARIGREAIATSAAMRARLRVYAHPQPITGEVALR